MERNNNIPGTKCVRNLVARTLELGVKKPIVLKHLTVKTFIKPPF